VASGYAQATTTLSRGAAEPVLASAPMSTAGITAAAPIAARRVRVERFRRSRRGACGWRDS
jgi:hypothetical protein